MKVSLKTLVEYVLLLLVIIQCHSMFSQAAGGIDWLWFLVPLMVVHIILQLLDRPLTKSFVNSLFIFLGGYYLIQALLLALNLGANINREFIGLNLLTMPLSIVLLSLQVYRGEWCTFLKRFNHIVAVMAIMSVFFWLFGSMLHILRPTGVVINQWADGAPATHYFRLYFETQRLTVLGMLITRNSGIFVEGPIWNLILCIAFINESFLLDKTNRMRLILFVITIATVFSTTGIYIVGLSAMAYIFVLRKARYKMLMVPSLAGVFYVLTLALEEKSATNSASIRLDDYYAGLAAWRERLLSGWGQGGLSRIQYHMNTQIRPNLGYSNSLFVVLAKGGLLQAIAQYLPVVGLVVFPKISTKLRISAALLMVLIITVIFQNTALYCFCIAMCYAGTINYIRVN